MFYRRKGTAQRMRFIEHACEALGNSNSPGITFSGFRLRRKLFTIHLARSHVSLGSNLRIEKRRVTISDRAHCWELQAIHTSFASAWATHSEDYNTNDND